MRFPRLLAYLAITIIGLLLAINTANCDDHKMEMTFADQKYTYMRQVLAMMHTANNMHREYGELGIKTVARKLDSGVSRDQIQEKFLTIVPEEMHAAMRKAFKTGAELATLVEPKLNSFEKEVLRLKLASKGKSVKVTVNEKKAATELFEFAQKFVELLDGTEGTAKAMMETIMENMNRYIFERDEDLQVKNRNKNDAALLCHRITIELNDLIEGAKKMKIIKLRMPTGMSGLADKLANIYELVKSMIATMPKKIRDAKRKAADANFEEAKKLIVQYRQLLIWQQFLSAAFQFGKRMRDLLRLFSENMLTLAIMNYKGNSASGLIVKLVEVKEKRLNAFLDGTYLPWSSRLAQLSAQERWEGGKLGEEMDKNVMAENLQSKLEPAFAMLLWLYRQLDMRVDCLDIYERFGKNSQPQNNSSDDEETSASKQSRIRHQIVQEPLDVPDEAQLMEKFLKSDDSNEERPSSSRRRDKSSERRRERKKNGSERSVSVTRTEETRARRSGRREASGSRAPRNSNRRRSNSGNKERRQGSPEKDRKSHRIRRKSHGKERTPAAESNRRDNANDDSYRKSRSDREGRRKHGSSSGGRHKSGSKRPKSSERPGTSRKSAGGGTRGYDKHETRHRRNSRDRKTSNNKREEEHGNRRRSAAGGGKRRSHHHRKN